MEAIANDNEANTHQKVSNDYCLTLYLDNFYY